MKTRREQKHEMLLTFMANVKGNKRRANNVKPRILKTFLSLFL